MKELETIEFDARVTRRIPGPPDCDGRCVVYWMQRAQRASDNAALDCAINLGNLLGKPVVVYFGLRERVTRANLRHYQFMVEGLSDLPVALRRRGVAWVLRLANHEPIEKFCAASAACLLVSDEDPRRSAEFGRERVARLLRIPFWTVDADVIVPSRLLAKEHYAARTIRPKIRAQLDRFLSRQAEPKASVPWPGEFTLPWFSANADTIASLKIDRSVQPVTWLRGGERAATKRLKDFVVEKLPGYADGRNKPELDATSRLSPYLHFGQIGPHAIVQAINNATAPAADRAAFLEEFIVRRELAVNFVRFNDCYDRFDACEPWADVTLRHHAGDARPHLYDDKQLGNAETHDPLWNAAQKQMVLTGWMHGYMRMYWAKKILEWSRTPAEAYRIAVELNDRYELDGRDPNGYAGIAWAIVGKHDRAWGPERPIYGKVRYMSYASTSRKFNSRRYIEQIAALERGGRLTD